MILALSNAISSHLLVLLNAYFSEEIDETIRSVYSKIYISDKLHSSITETDDLYRLLEVSTYNSFVATTECIIPQSRCLLQARTLKLYQSSRTFSDAEILIFCQICPSFGISKTVHLHTLQSTHF